MYKNDLDRAYQTLMESICEGLDATIEEVFKKCSGEWNADFAEKTFLNFYNPVNPGDVLISFSGATDFEDKDTTIDYLFAVHEKNVHLVYAEVNDTFIGMDRAYGVLEQVLNKASRNPVV